jgi:hypothetical protein
MKNILKVHVIGQITYLAKVKSHFERQEPGLFFNFGQVPRFWIRIRFSNTNPDPRQRQTNADRIRIHRTHMFLGLPDPDPLLTWVTW